MTDYKDLEPFIDEQLEANAAPLWSTLRDYLSEDKSNAAALMDMIVFMATWPKTLETLLDSAPPYGWGKHIKKHWQKVSPPFIKFYDEVREAFLESNTPELRAVLEAAEEAYWKEQEENEQEDESPRKWAAEMRKSFDRNEAMHINRDMQALDLHKWGE